jgi:hypothetical protein
LEDPDFEVRCGVAETVGYFSENVSEFVDAGDEIIPALLGVMEELANTTTPLECAFNALNELIKNMVPEDVIKQYAPLVNILTRFLAHPSDTTKEHALEVLSSVVISADELLKPDFATLMPLVQAVHNTTGSMHSAVRASALQTIGHMAKAVGKEMFAPFLLEYTNISLEIIKQGERGFEFGEAAFSYLCSISKILKDEMESFLPIVVSAALETIKSERGMEKVEKVRGFAEDEEEKQLMKLNPDSIDEKTSAVHCVGYLVRFCPELMKPHLELVLEELGKVANWYHPNIRIEVISTYMQIALGLASLSIGDIDDFEFIPGVESNLGPMCETFLSKVYFPHVAEVFESETDNDNVERQMQNIVELIDILGAAFLKGRVEETTVLINGFLMSDEGEEEEEEEVDHDEILIANTCDIIISVS